MARNTADDRTARFTEPERGAGPRTSDEPFDVGDSLGRYIILHRAGEGGMAFVYAAYDPVLDRKVAIKVLRSSREPIDDDDEQRTLEHDRALALREAQALARLSHPNVLPVFDVGMYEGRVFFATEFVDGSTMKDWLEAQPRSRTEILDVMHAAGRGLAAAHAQGFVHRDFKPQNVMIGVDGRVRVMDFGLVGQNVSGDDDGMTNTGSGLNTSRLLSTAELSEPSAWMGTPQYMAPEQHAGSDVDALADLYAFCVSLYEALWGAKPFAGVPHDGLVEVKERMQFTTTASASDVPRWLAKVVLRGLRPHREQRWPSMEALLTALQRDPAQRRRRGLAAAALLLVAGGAVSMYADYRHTQATLCSGGTARLAGVWDDSRRDAIERAFVRSHLSYAADTWTRVEATLESYADQWVAMHREACEATEVRHEQSSAVLDDRMACLDGRLRDLNALVAVFADADDTVVRNASLAATKLPSVDKCGDLETLRAEDIAPPDASIVEQVGQLRERLSTAKAEQLAGRTVRAVELTQAIATNAETLGYQPLEAQARLLLAFNLAQSGRLAEAEAPAFEAAWLAEANAMPSELARARSLLIFIVGYGLGRIPEGNLWVRLTEAALRRLPNPVEERVSYEHNRATLLGREGKREEALAIFRELADRDDPNSPGVINTLLSVGTTADYLRRFDEADAYFARAIDLGTKLLGPSHPTLGMAYGGRGDVAYYQGRYDEAERELLRALSIYEEAGGSSYLASFPLRALGWTAIKQNRFAQAEDYFQRSLVLLGETMGDKHPDYASALAGLADAHRAAGDYAKARDALARSLAIRAELDSGSADHQTTLVTLALLDLETGRLNDAVTHAERAFAFTKDHPPSRTLMADIKFTLARAIVDSDRHRAQTLAREALELAIEVEGVDAKERLDELRQWIERHP